MSLYLPQARQAVTGDELLEWLRKNDGNWLSNG